MNLFEGILIIGTISIYAIGLIALLLGLINRKDKFVKVGQWIAIVAFAFHTAAIVTRWVNTGHAPVTSTFENSLTGTWFILGLFITMYRRKGREVLGAIIIAVCLLILGHGIVSGTDPRSYVQQFRGVWLPVHVCFALLAFGSYTITTGLAALYIARQRRGDPDEKESGHWLDRMPEPGVLEDLTFRYVLLGFVTHIIMIGSGAIWAHGLWGRYWGWDPVETWSLISWIIYGIVIHLKVTLGWSGTRLAWLVLGSFLGVLMAYGGIGFVTSLHVGIF